MKNNFFLKLLMLSVMGFGVTDGEGGGSDDAEAQAAAQVIADKIAADKAATDKAAADKADKGMSDSEAKLLRELMEKKSSLKETKDQLDQTKAKLSQFDGINLEEIKVMLAERSKAENQKLEDKGEWDRLKANLLTQHTEEKAALEAKLQALQDDLSNKDGRILGLTIGSAFATSKFIADEMTLTPSKAQIIYGNHFEYQDGKIIGYDKPKGSENRTPLIGSNGEPLSFNLAVAKIVDGDPDKDYLLRSKAKAGANSGTSGNTTIKPPSEGKGMSRIQGALNES